MKRVVVTGLGALTPIGNSVETYWRSLISGKSGAAKISRFDSGKFRTQIACELKDFDATRHLDRAEIKRTDPFTQYALVAAGEALQDSGLDLS